MEDTLRYFFSAVFQGFAAVITLGIMFYLSYLDKLRQRLDDIDSIFLSYRPAPGSEDDFYVKEHGLVLCIKNKLLPTKKDVPDNDYVRRLVSEYDEKIEQKNSLNNKLLTLFQNAIIVILISLVSLFCVGYINWFNHVLFVAGISTIILSIIFFFKLFSFIKSIIDKP